MKKLALITILFASVGIFLGLHFNSDQTQNVVRGIQNQVDTIPSHEAKPKKEPATPQTISIPSLDVHNVTVEQVGLDAEKRMDVPSSFLNTGWYKFGPKPGEIGNAVIDGHLDTPTGAPSVFWDIKNMQPGDSIEITDARGNTLTFSVTKVVTYETNNFPIETVFGDADQANLNLITCGGIWDRQKKDYSNRTVVFSTLKN